jgi:hypothetical protein
MLTWQPPLTAFANSGVFDCNEPDFRHHSGATSVESQKIA